MTSKCVAHFVCSADHIVSVCDGGSELLLGFFVKHGLQESTIRHNKLMNHTHIEWSRDGKEVEVCAATQFCDANSDLHSEGRRTCGYVPEDALHSATSGKYVILSPIQWRKMWGRAMRN
jgi:hypothetical protein